MDYSWILYFVLSIIGFGLGFLITRHRDPIDNATLAVIDIITTKKLDETSFRPNDLVKAQSSDENLTEDEIQAILDKLANLGVLKEVKGNWFRLEDPLVFLQPKDIKRAERITKNDNILYGGYSEPFLSNKFLFLIYFIFIATFLIGVLAFLIWEIKDFLGNILPDIGIASGGVASDNILILPFVLFIVAYSYIVVDMLENLIQAYGRERYSLVVGLQSGISYDINLADEFSGIISRGQIRGIDLDISNFQKIYNYFAAVPRGNVTIKTGSKKKVTFVNVPFPRELTYVIKSVMLKSLAWRKRNAKTMMMWRARGGSGVMMSGGK